MHFENFIRSAKPLFVLMLASISLANINAFIYTAGLIVSLAYGIRKFVILEREEKRKSKIKQNEKDINLN